MQTLRIARKLTTKPFWWIERRRSYAIRNYYDRLPPLEVRSGGIRYVVLTTPQTLNDALWAAWSWYRFMSPHNFELQIAVDGDIGEIESKAARKLFPGISIYNVRTIIDSLSYHYPSLTRFLDDHPISKQVGLVLALSRQGPIVYSDHDVVAFNPPVELFTCIQRNTPCYFLDHENGCHDPLLEKTVTSMGLEYIRRLNAGFMYIPHNAISVDLAEKILGNWKPVPFFYFTPQTLMSTLMRDAHAYPLPESRYVISNRRQFYWEEDVNYRSIAARHFTGTVRHVLYKYGMPILLEQSRGLVPSMPDRAHETGSGLG